jgi:hypothetical protein
MSLLNDASLVVTPNAYKEGKLYSIIPSNGNGDFSVTRATTATRVNAAGSVEAVPYNLAQYSEMFSQGVWAKTNVNISANVAIAPNGTLTADKMIATSAGNNPFMAQDGISSNGPTTLSVYAKKGELNWLRLTNFSASYSAAWFDLNNGTIGTVSGTAAPTATITNAGNGWYRCTITLSSFSIGSAADFVIACTNANNTTNGYTGNNVDGIFIWGAQAVDGILARDYQITETRLNVPRLDYSLGSCPNILVEPQRTNLVFPSATLTTQTRTVTAAAHTLSFYGTGTIALSGVFAGTLVGTGVNNRVTLTFTPTAGSLTLTVSGSVTLGQLEAGSYATSYIPTTSTTVTRNLDQILRNNVYTNGLITASGGTWFVELRGNVPVIRDLSTSGIFLNTGVSSTIGNGFVLRNPGSSLSRIGIFTVVAGGLSTNLHTIATENAKVAFKWNGTTANIFVNGVKVVAATPFTPTTMENLIAEGSNRAIQINSMALFPTPLTDGQCSMLTSGIYTPALAYAQLGLVSESPACLDSSVNALL